MTRDDIIRLAREAGIDAEDDTLCRNEGWVEPMVKFAALVIGNHQPRSSMSWQEGYEIGVATEREACAKVCDVFAVSAFDDEAGIALNIQKSIRARGQV
jgi:hypothetical protein